MRIYYDEKGSAIWSCCFAKSINYSDALTLFPVCRVKREDMECVIGGLYGHVIDGNADDC